MAMELKQMIKSRVSNDFLLKIDTLAMARQENRSETIRYLLQRGIDQEFGEKAIDPTLRMVRGAMAEVMKPLENRLASIMSKTTITAAQATALLKVMIEQVTALEVEETWDITYQYGVRFLRDKYPSLFMDIARKVMKKEESVSDSDEENKEFDAGVKGGG